MSDRNIRIALVRSTFVVGKGQCTGSKQRPFVFDCPPTEAHRLVDRGFARYEHAEDQPDFSDNGTRVTKGGVPVALKRVLGFPQVAHSESEAKRLAAQGHVVVREPIDVEIDTTPTFADADLKLHVPATPEDEIPGGEPIVETPDEDRELAATDAAIQEAIANAAEITNEDVEALAEERATAVARRKAARESAKAAEKKQ